MKKISINAVIAALIVTAVVTFSTGYEAVESIQFLDCPPDATFDPDALLDGNTGMYVLNLSDLVTNDQGTDLCMLRSVDFDFGPALLPNNDTIFVNEVPAYRFNNGCESSGDRLFSEQDSLGNTINVDTIQFVLCETTLRFCDNELGVRDITILESQDGVTIDTCRVQVTLGSAINTGEENPDGENPTMPGGNPTAMFNPNLACSLDGQTVSVRSTFQDADTNDGEETVRLADTSFVVMTDGAAELISVSDIYDIDFNAQTIEFTWNQTGSIGPRTIRAGQFYRFYVDLGADVNEVIFAERDEILSGGFPEVNILDQNTLVVEWGAGQSIGETFNAVINLNLIGCATENPGTGGEQDTMMMPMDTMVVTPVDTMVATPIDSMDVTPIDTMEVTPVDTMVVVPVDTMTTMPEPTNPVTDTGFDCTDDLAFTYDITDLADSTITIEMMDLPTETADVLTFDLSGNPSTIDTIRSSDTLLVIDSMFVADSIMIMDTSLVLTTTLTFDTSMVGTDTIFNTTTTIELDSTFLRTDSIITLDSVATMDSVLVVSMVLTSVDSSVVNDTMLVVDSIFSLDSMVLIDTIMMSDTIISIDSTMFTIDSSEVIGGLDQLDSIFRVDTITSFDTTSFVLDSMFMPDSMFVRDTMFDMDSMLVVDSTLVIDSVLSSIDTLLMIDTMNTVQDVFIGFDTLMGMDTMVVTDTIFAMDTTIVNTTTFDSSFVVDRTFERVDSMTVITMNTVLDSMFMLDSMLVNQGGFRVDTMINLVDIFSVDSVATIDTMIIFQSVFTVDTISMIDSMQVITATQVPDSILVIQNIIASIDSSISTTTRTVLDSIFIADTMLVLDSVFVSDTMLQLDSTLLIDSMQVMDTVTILNSIFAFDTTGMMIDSSFIIDSMLVDGVFVVDSMTLVLDTILTLDSTFVRTDTSIVVNSFLARDTTLSVDTTRTVVTTGFLDSVSVITQTFVRVDSVMILDTIIALDTMFTQMSVFREAGEFIRDSSIIIENSERIVFDLLAMDGDTICGNLIAREISNLNMLNYSLRWNAAAFSYLGCTNGLVAGIGCDIASVDSDIGMISGSYSSAETVSLSSESVIAQFCFTVVDDDIETPVPFSLSQTFNNAATISDVTIDVATSLSLSDLGIQAVETITVDGREVLVNRCIVYAANFDAGSVNPGTGEIAFGYVEGCSPDGMVNGMSYAVCQQNIEICCDEIGTKEVVILTRTQEGIIGECRVDVDITDNNRFCNPLISFECRDDILSIPVNDLSSNGDGQFTINLSDLGVTTNVEDYCILKTVDFNAGPVTLSTGDVAIVDGELTYTAVNACSADDEFIESILNQDGSIREERTLPYVICKSTLTLCCEDLEGVDITVVTKDGDGISSSCVTTVSAFDPSVAISCGPLNVQCTDDINAAENRPDITGAGLCSVTADLLFVDNSTEIDTCGLGTISRTWYIDSNANGTIDSMETSCTQLITILAEDAFDPLSIRWPAHRNGSSRAGVRLTCTDSTTVSEESLNSIFLGDPINCSNPNDGFGIATWCESNCDLLAYTSEIESMVDQSGACVEVVVRHTIIDWCTYTALGRPDDGAGDLADANFEAVEDLRDGCETCSGDGSLTYIRYVPSMISIDGIYNYEQTISLNDDTAPIINSPDTVIVSTTRELDSNGNPLGCSGIDSLTISATDVCGASQLSGDLEWRVRVRNFIGFPVFDADGLSEYTFTGSEFTLSTRSGDEGFFYFVLIDVTDACGNEASKVTTIRFDDVTPPTPICLTTAPVVAVGDTMATTIVASDLNLNSIDNCTVPNNLRYSIVPRGVTPINPRELAFSTQRSVDIECENVDTSRAFDVWVWDSSRNGAKCEIDIRIQADCTAPIDTTGMGPGMIDSTGIFITGKVTTPMGVAVPGVNMTLLNADTTQIEFSRMTQSANDGSYVFNNNALFQDFRLNAVYDDELLNGVTTLDLVLIQKHILGGDLLDSPFKVIAADADGSQSVSVSDIIVFRNLIVGNIDRLPNNDSWIIIPADQSFADTLSPWPLLEDINISNLEVSLSDQDFIAIKIGDVNDNASAQGFGRTDIRTSEEPVEFRMTDRYLNRGESATIEVSVSQAKHLLGFQLSLEHEGLVYNSSGSEVLSWGGSNLNNQATSTRVSWSDIRAISDEQSLFYMDFTATESGMLSEMLRLSHNDIASEAYQGLELTIHDVTLIFEEPRSDLFTVHQNQPNPFADNTVIKLSVPSAGMVETTVFDISGKVLYRESDVLSRGDHSIVLRADDLGSSGIMYYQLMYDDQIETRKMILLK